MPFDCAWLHAPPLEACRHIVISQPRRIEPIFKSRDTAIVLERSTVPDTFKRRNLIVTSTSQTFDSTARICADAHLKNVISFQMAVWYLEFTCHGQLIAGVDRK